MINPCLTGKNLALTCFLMLVWVFARAQNLPGLPTGNQTPEEIAPTRKPLENLRQQQMQKTIRQNQQQFQQQVIEQNTRRAMAEAESESLRAEERRRQQAAAPFLKAGTQLLAMAEGKSHPQVKKAAFLVENAFHHNQLSYQTYCAQIAGRVAAMKRYAAWKKMDWKSYKTRALLLVRFFSDTIRMPGGIMHHPPVYDFEDPYGEKDYRQFFVTKLLRTNKGQCHSLPLLYKILADEIGVKAYLSLSPSHTFIQFLDENRRLVWFETTNGHIVSDRWMAGSGFVKRQALESRIYLDTLGNKATVLYCLQDLAEAYIYRFGYDQTALDLINNGLAHNPKDIRALALKANFVTCDVNRQLKEIGQPPVGELDSYPAVKKNFEYMRRLYEYIDALGYAEMPRDDYQKWLNGINREAAGKAVPK